MRDEIHLPDNGMPCLLVPTRQGVSNHSAGRPTQNALQPTKIPQIQQPSIAAHKLNSRTLSFPELGIKSVEKPIEVRAEHRRKVRIGRAGYPARDELNHGQERGALGDVREANIPRELAHLLLMSGVGVGVRENNRERAVAVVVELLEVLPEAFEILSDSRCQGIRRMAKRKWAYRAL